MNAKNPSSAHMPDEDFKELGARFLDWITRYLDGVEQMPVGPNVEPGDVRAALPASPPETPEDLAEVFADIDQVVVPGLTHWQHPGWFAYFPCNHSYPSVLGELLCAGLGIQGMLWSTSPACTEVESLMMDWMLEALGLPERFRTAPIDDPRGHCTGGGVIQDTASSATLCALIAARDRATGRGLAPSSRRAPCSRRSGLGRRRRCPSCRRR